MDDLLFVPELSPIFVPIAALDPLVLTAQVVSGVMGFGTRRRIFIGDLSVLVADVCLELCSQVFGVK